VRLCSLNILVINFINIKNIMIIVSWLHFTSTRRPEVASVTKSGREAYRE